MTEIDIDRLAREANEKAMAFYALKVKLAFAKAEWRQARHAFECAQLMAEEYMQPTRETRRMMQ